LLLCIAEVDATGALVDKKTGGSLSQTAGIV
jgi:hypothetical protein